MQVERIKQLSAGRREQLMARSAVDVGDVYEQVAKIVHEVRLNGDQANLQQHGASDIEQLKVGPAEMEAAFSQVDKKVVKALEQAAVNISTFHKAQLERPQWQMEVAKGIRAGRKITPLKRVGCYVPGMRAVYPSTALMTIIPAKVAGVKQVVVCSPPDENLRINPQTLVACRVAGVDEIYKLGGPWAIASMAWGTRLLPKVNKIVGPGNKYVTAAKMQVFGQVDIDSPAGPSEALIIADHTAKAQWLALDFLAQMEHDPDAAAVLVSTDENLAHAVAAELTRLIPTMPRGEILQASGRYAALLLADNMDEAISFSNEYAPEHLQIITQDPWDVLAGIDNAGSIFLGPYAPVAVGDYASGTNHVLPTAGGAHSFSGLSVDDFIKKPTFQFLTEGALKTLAPTIIALAENEGLHIHALSVKERLKKDESPA